ncbi:MAG: hypothetical protein WC202_02575 [Desulfobacterales bacterium]|jgi:hypothetical protein
MKKFAVLGLAVVLVIAFTVPAMAIESVFGGYWRTRAYTQQNFGGNDQGDYDTTLVDTRTRLYYTAIFNENFKFVNKFEFDAAWGGPAASYGDIGADGVSVEVKNSYVDFTLGSVNSKIGVQPYKLGRGLLFNDDFGGAIFTYKAEAFELPLFWIKAYEGGMDDADFVDDDTNDYDIDYVGIAPKFSFGDAGSIQPIFVYAFSDDASLGADAMNWPFGPDIDDTDRVNLEELQVFYAGFDLDLNFDMISMWLTGIYQFGSVDYQDGDDADVNAWMAAIGAKANFDTFDIHGQAFYLSGQEEDEEDIEMFIPLKGQDYHWAEIMGGGIFDNATGYSNNNSRNAGGYNTLTDIMAFNIGAGFKATDDLSFKLDIWYAALAEAILNDLDQELDEELGTEVDLVATYKLMDGLTLDLVGAYLFAGDSTTLDVDDDENPYELGAQLSLSF